MRSLSGTSTVLLQTSLYCPFRDTYCKIFFTTYDVCKCTSRLPAFHEYLTLKVKMFKNPLLFLHQCTFTVHRQRLHSIGGSKGARWTPYKFFQF